MTRGLVVLVFFAFIVTWLVVFTAMGGWGG